MNKTVDTRICEVTVYNDQALVTRRGVVQLTGEERELVVAQLPVTLVSESVRVSSKSKAMQLLGVQTKRTYTAETIQEQAAQISQEIVQIEEQKRQGQDQQALLNLQRNFVKSLSSQYLERITKSSDPDPLNFEQIRELMDFVGQQYNELSNVIATLDKEQKQLDKQLQTLRGQLQQLSTPNQESVSIIVTLEPSTAGELELEVSYVVHQASWTPIYNLRLNATSEIIHVSGLADVKQSSGEDWVDVALTLSTAKPELSTLPSKLLPWYIDVQQFNLRGHKAKATEFNTIPPRVFSTIMPFPGMSPVPEAAIDTELELIKAQMVTEVFKHGGIISYKASNRGSIKSDGVTHKTVTFSKDYRCCATYIAIPQLASLAYLQATITNPLDGNTLLPGKANIFWENNFIGTVELEKIAPGQDFKLNLGIDEGLKIERKLVERHVDKKLMGEQWNTTYAYQLIITNLREYNADLTLIEQLPVSRNEQIKVQLTSSNPQIETDDLGMLEWSLTLPPLSSQELYYQFTVEHPPELVVVGLDI